MATENSGPPVRVLRRFQVRPPSRVRSSMPRSPSITPCSRSEKATENRVRWSASVSRTRSARRWWCAAPCRGRRRPSPRGVDTAQVPKMSLVVTLGGRDPGGSAVGGPQGGAAGAHRPGPVRRSRRRRRTGRPSSARLQAAPVWPRRRWCRRRCRGCRPPSRCACRRTPGPVNWLPCGRRVAASCHDERRQLRRGRGQRCRRRAPRAAPGDAASPGAGQVRVGGEPPRRAAVVRHEEHAAAVLARAQLRAPEHGQRGPDDARSAFELRTRPGSCTRGTDGRGRPAPPCGRRRCSRGMPRRRSPPARSTSRPAAHDWCTSAPYPLPSWYGSTPRRHCRVMRCSVSLPSQTNAG